MLERLKNNGSRECKKNLMLDQKILALRMSKIYKLKSEVIVYQGMSAWRFLAVSKKETDEIKKKYGKLAKGWGSLPVSVKIGRTKWETSIFPDKKSGTYLLPLKAKVRKEESIMDDAVVPFSFTLR